MAQAKLNAETALKKNGVMLITTKILPCLGVLLIDLLMMI